jgi:hypothetical protein
MTGNAWLAFLGWAKKQKSAGRLYDGWLLFISKFPYIDGTQSTIFRRVSFPCYAIMIFSGNYSARKVANSKNA